MRSGPRPVVIRTCTEADLPQLVSLSNEATPDYGWTLEELRHWDADWRPPGFFERRMVAEDSGAVVGFCLVFHSRGQFVPDNYNVELMVRPAARRRGIGLGLYRDAERILRDRRAHWARTAVKGSVVEGVAFARAIGAVELKRDWESRLDVPSFEPSRFAAAPARAAAAGVRITTLADEMRTDVDAVQRAYRLHAEARLDVPGLDPATPSPFERFERDVLHAPSSLPGAHFIAIRAGRYVGESALGREGADPTVIHQQLTGVLHDERRKGIAMALKLKTVEYARSNGFRTIRTWNDSLNRPMLAINESLGFVKEPAWITFGKDLRAGEDGAAARG